MYMYSRCGFIRTLPVTHLTHNSRVCSKKQAMDGVVLTLRSSDVGQPLCGETGPLESMSHHQVVEERSVLLPYLVLLVYYSFFHPFVVHCGITL